MDSRILKYILFFFNFIYFLFGLTCFAVGCWARTDYDFKSFTDRIGGWEELYIGAYAFIGIGIIIVIMSLVGCLGAFNDNRTMLGIFFAVTFILFLIELALATYLFVWTWRNNWLLPQMRQRFDRIMVHYGLETPEGKYWTERMNEIQEWFDCCGSNGTDDYMKRPYIDQVPKSCRSVHGYAFELGCGNALFNEFQKASYIIGGVAFSLAFIQVFSMGASLLLLCMERVDYNKRSGFL